MCYHYTMLNVTHSILVLQPHSNRRYWWSQIIIAFEFLGCKSFVGAWFSFKLELKKNNHKSKSENFPRKSHVRFPSSYVSSMTAQHSSIPLCTSENQLLCLLKKKKKENADFPKVEFTCNVFMSIRDLKVWIPLTSWGLWLPSHLCTFERYIPPPSWKSTWFFFSSSSSFKPYFCSSVRNRGELLPVNLRHQVCVGGGKSGLKKRARQVAKGKERTAARSRACNEATLLILHFMDENVPNGSCAFTAVR